MLVVVLVPLQGINLLDPAAAYQRAHELFIHGDLKGAQNEAERGSRKFRQIQPDWATKFAFLEAEAMLWRGMYEQALALLDSQADSKNASGLAVEKLTLQGVALIHLGRLDEADRRLSLAASLCGGAAYAECGTVPRARGVEAVTKGNASEARKQFLASLAFARAHGDRELEATSLLNLGTVALGDEHFDEALDWCRLAYQAGVALGEDNQVQAALGNLGWAYFKLGDVEGSLKNLPEAQKKAARVGNISDELSWLSTIGYVYAEMGKAQPAEQSYLQALKLATQINNQQEISDITTDLALVAIESGKADEADSYAKQALARAQRSGSKPDVMDATAIQMQAAAMRGDAGRAASLMDEVEAAPESQMSMKWASELAMARMYEAQGQTAQAQGKYAMALATFETARSQLKHEDSQLPFVANATRIYDDYIHFLIAQGKTDEALLAADQSRARTLSQGLGVADGRAAQMSPRAVARKADATLLFYWLGQKQSYLWAIGPTKTTLITLPAEGEIAPMIERYSKALLGPEDPVAAGNADGAALYAMLVAPVAGQLRANATVMILADGPLCRLNFETLIAPANGAVARAHYWIEDATVVAAPSLAMLASARPVRGGHGNLLLLGDAVQPDANYPQLPYAAVEMKQVGRHFNNGDRVIYSQARATPAVYLASNPRQYAYIHFVSHGVASQTDPLDSAIILSRGAAGANARGGQEAAGQDSFKLYARDIMQHPIDARLVTISACYGSGTRSYAGEGLVGLSWAFLHAGAHNAVGALWEASDRSTAQLMDELYQGLEDGASPADALRRAKLSLLHGANSFRKPFYWAAFQMYTRL